MLSFSVMEFDFSNARHCFCLIDRNLLRLDLYSPCKFGSLIRHSPLESLLCALPSIVMFEQFSDNRVAVHVHRHAKS